MPAWVGPTGCAGASRCCLLLLPLSAWQVHRVPGSNPDKHSHGAWGNCELLPKKAWHYSTSLLPTLSHTADYSRAPC
ncbi:hypothetical protein V8C86DRAFT_2626576 [Haematococcus lacustris]